MLLCIVISMSIILLSVSYLMLSAAALSVIILIVVILRVDILNVIMLSVVLLIVVAPPFAFSYKLGQFNETGLGPNVIKLFTAVIYECLC